MSAIVPWTYPGGPPCCCIVDCPAITENVSTATRHSISESLYASLYAGGTMRISHSGNVSINFQSVFGTPPAWTCEGGGSWQRVTDFLCIANQCISQSSRTLVSSTTSGGGEVSAPSYQHLLESNFATNTFSVIFGVFTSGGAFRKCDIGQEGGATVQALTYNNGIPPLTGGGGRLNSRMATTIDLEIDGTTIAVPAFIEAFTGVQFFSIYTSLDGTAEASGVWEPSAP